MTGFIIFCNRSSVIIRVCFHGKILDLVFWNMSSVIIRTCFHEKMLDFIFCNKSNVMIRTYFHEKIIDLIFCNKSNIIISICFHGKLLDLIFCKKSRVIIRTWDPTFSHGSKFVLLHLTCYKIWWIRWLFAATFWGPFGLLSFIDYSPDRACSVWGSGAFKAGEGPPPTRASALAKQMSLAATATFSSPMFIKR